MELQNIILNPYGDKSCAVRDAKCSQRVLFWQNFFSENKPIAVLNLSIIENTTDWMKMCTPSVRNRLRHSKNLGYNSRTMTMKDRNERLNDLYEINTSAISRQGRIMNDSYKHFPQPQTDLVEVCPWHFDQFFGVFAPFGQWVGYVNLCVNGDFASISMLLGHVEFMKTTGIMLNIMETVVNFCLDQKLKYITYHRWDSGTDGLRYWKQSIGMKPMNVKIL